MGVPQNGWFIRENPHLKWMITRGTPIYGNPHRVSRILPGLPGPIAWIVRLMSLGNRGVVGSRKPPDSMIRRTWEDMGKIWGNHHPLNLDDWNGDL